MEIKETVHKLFNFDRLYISFNENILFEIAAHFELVAFYNYGIFANQQNGFLRGIRNYCLNAAKIPPERRDYGKRFQIVRAEFVQNLFKKFHNNNCMPAPVRVCERGRA